MSNLKIGDRVRLIRHLADEKNPKECGALGTVAHVGNSILGVEFDGDTFISVRTTAYGKRRFIIEFCELIPPDEELKLTLDELATKDAVIQAQSERIKELEGVLRRIADNAPLHVREIQTLSKDRLFNHTVNYCISGKIALAALPEESEADNG